MLNTKPFGGYVEGLSYWRNQSYAFEPAVQKDDLENPTLGGVACGKPLLLYAR